VLVYLSHQSDEYQHDFVEEPSKDFFCPVSLGVMHNSPQQTECCGHHLSLPVAEKLAKDRKPCPMCNKKRLVTHNDLYFERQVKDLNVYCKYKGSDCKWVGELRNFDSHCQSCPKQPWACSDCSQVMSLDEGGEKHFHRCPNKRVPCPNVCGVHFSLFDKDRHLRECPKQVVSCKFASSGCGVRLQRGDMEKHLEESLQQHMMAVTLTNSESLQCLHQRLDQVGFTPNGFSKKPAVSREREEMESILHQKDKELQQVQQELGVVKATLERQNTAMTQAFLREMHGEVQDILKFGYSSYIDFTLSNFYECRSSSPDGNWCGPQFNFPSDGYRMELSIDTNGYEQGAGTHLSAYINPLRGSYDGHIRWPVVCRLYLVLLNQCGDFGHHGKSAVFEWNRNCHDYQTISYTFISVSKLEHDPVRNTHYLRNDCLYFRLYLDMQHKHSYRVK